MSIQIVISKYHSTLVVTQDLGEIADFMFRAGHISDEPESFCLNTC